jgi:hypothetical protein
LAEIERLRAELSRLQGGQPPPLDARWWCLAALGVFLLATIPNLLLLAVQAIYGREYGNGPNLFAYIVWGVSIGLPWAQWSLIGIFGMLHHGPLWQRVLISVGLSVCSGFMLFISITIHNTDRDDVLMVGWIAPLLVLIIAFPMFLARIFRRWTLAIRGAKAVPRPVSLASYLVLMVVLGIAFTAAKFIPWDVIASSREDAAIYLIVFGGPLLSISFAHLWLLPKILNTRKGFAVSWAQWLWPCLVLAATLTISLAGPPLLLRPQTFDVEHIMRLAGLIAAIPCAGGIFIAAGYFWLRMLGYGLLSSRPSTCIAAPD